MSRRSVFPVLSARGVDTRTVTPPEFLVANPATAGRALHVYRRDLLRILRNGSKQPASGSLRHHPDRRGSFTAI